ncbi:MAG: hypothetical protein AAGI01_01180, partial [Myxococcota bacterium]
DAVQVDTDDDPLPFPDATFSCVVSDSAIEHRYYPEKALVAFSWCIAKSDAEPQRFRDRKNMLFGGADLLWMYKWIAESTPKFPQITRQQIDDTLAHMKERYVRHNLSLRPVHMQYTRWMMMRGASDAKVREHHEAWNLARRDAYADCAACERAFDVEVYLHLRNVEGAKYAAKPLIEGDLGCTEVPHVTFAALLLPLLQAGEYDLAKRYHERGYAITRDKKTLLVELALHLDYAARVGLLDRTVQMIERHASWALESLRLRDKMRWLMAAEHAVRRLADGGRDTVLLRLPEQLPYYVETHRYEPRAVATHFAEHVDAIAAQFDARNGNTYVSETVRAHRAWAAERLEYLNLP